jgi:hypothetical protein
MNDTTNETNHTCKADHVCGPLRCLLDSIQHARDILSFKVVSDDIDDNPKLDQAKLNLVAHTDIYPPKGMAFYYHPDGSLAGVYPEPEPYIELNFIVTKDGVDYEPMRKSA